MSALGNLVVSLSLETAAFTKGIDKSSYEAQKFAKELDQKVTRSIQGATDGLKGFAAGALGAIGAVTTVSAALSKLNNVFQQLDEAAKNAQRFGVPIEELSALTYAADLSGVSLETLGVGLKNLLKNANEAAQGTKEQSQLFRALGIDVTDASGKVRSTTDIFTDSAQAISLLEDGAVKTSLSLKIFGKSGADLIPLLNEGKDGLNELTDEAQRLGLVMTAESAAAAEAYNDNLSRLNGTVDGLFITLANNALPSLSEFTQEMVVGVKATDSLTSSIFALLNIAAGDFLGKSLNDRLGESRKKLNELEKMKQAGELYSGVAGGLIRASPLSLFMKTQKDYEDEKANLALLEFRMNKTIDPLLKPPSDGISAEKLRENIAKETEAREKKIKAILGEDQAKKALDAADKKRDEEKKKRDKELKDQHEELLKIQANAIEQQMQAIDAEIESTEKIREQILAMDDQTRAYGASEKQLRDLELSKIDDQIATKRQQLEITSFCDANSILIDKYKEQIQALEELRIAKVGFYNKKEVIDQAQAVQDAFKSTVDEIERSLTDSLLRGFDSGKSFAKSFGDQVTNYFKALAVKIPVQFVTAAAGSMLGINNAAAQGVGSSASASVQSALFSDPMGMVKQAFGALSGGSIAGGVEDAVLSLGNTVANTFGDSAFTDSIFDSAQGIGEMANTLGTAVAYLGAIDAGLNGQYMTALGTGLGTFFGGPLGGAIGSMVGGFLDKAFGFNGGGGQKSEGGYYSNGTGFTGNGALNAQTEEIARSTIKRYEQITAQLGGVAQRLAVDTFIGQDPIGDAQTQLAFNAAIGGQQIYNRAGFGRGYENVGRTEEALKAEVEDVAVRTIVAALQKTDLEDSLDSLFSSLDLVTDSLETLKAALDKASIIRFLNLNLNTFAVNVRALSTASIESFDALVKAAGGTEQFSASLGQYLNTFATDSEKFASAQRNLQQQFVALGISVPASIADLRNLIDAQDLTTEAGRANYLALINLAQAYKAVQDQTEALTAAQSNARKSLADSIQTIDSDFAKFTQDLQDRANSLSPGAFAQAIGQIQGATNSVSSAQFEQFVRQISTATPTDLAYQRFIEQITGAKPDEASYQAFIQSIAGAAPGTAAYNAFVGQIQDATNSVTSAGFEAFMQKISGLAPNDLAYKAFVESISNASPNNARFADFVTQVQGTSNVAAGAIGTLQDQIQALQTVVTRVDFSETFRALADFDQAIRASFEQLRMQTDFAQQINTANALKQQIESRYALEVQLLSGIETKAKEVFASITSQRVATREAAIQILGGPLVQTASQIRAGIAQASSLGQLPTADLQTANERVAQVIAQQKAQQDTINSLSGQQGAAQAALAAAQTALSTTKASELSAAQQGIAAAMKLSSQFGVWLNGNAGGTGSPFAVRDGAVLTDYQSIGYNIGNEAGVSRFKTAFNSDTSQVGGRTAFDAIFNANARIAQAQAQLAPLADQLAAKTLSLAAAQAKASEFTSLLNQAELERTKAQEAFTVQIQQYVIDAGKAVTKLGSLREETVKYFEQQKQLAGLMLTSAQGIRGVIENVRIAGLGSQDQLQALQGKFASAVASANTASGEALAKYGDTISNLIDPILQKAGEVYGVGGFDYEVLKGSLLNQAESIAGRIEALSPKDYQQESLSLLDTIDTSLALIEANTKSAEALIVQAIGESKVATVDALRQVLNSLQGNPVQAFAAGGYVSGAGTSTSDSIRAYLSNGEYVMRGSAVDKFGIDALDQINQGMMPVIPLPVGLRNQGASGGVDNRAELREVRMAIERLERTVMIGDQQIAKNTGKTAKAMERVEDGDALVVRVVS